MDIVLTVALITGVVVSMILGLPMRKHLLRETEIKTIMLFQIPFYLKDYNKMIDDDDDASKKRRFRTFFIIYLLSNLLIVAAGLILIFSVKTARL